MKDREITKFYKSIAILAKNQSEVPGNQKDGLC